MGGFGVACTAIEALTMNLAGELGPRGVRVVYLRPERIPETWSQYHGRQEARRNSAAGESKGDRCHVGERARKERRVRRLVIGMAACAALLVGTAPAGAHTFTIRGDWKMGEFRVKRDGTLRGAIDAFGTPGDRDRRFGGAACTVRWPRHGLRIDFYNLGGRNACRPAFGFFSDARARGPHWETNRGLAIGDRRRRLRSLYPDAEHHSSRPGSWPAGWWLVHRSSRFGVGGSYPGLLADVNERRVQTFHIRYPAGGD
jgi:hypothetical protein